LNTQIIIGGAGTVRQRVIDIETQVITGGGATLRQRVADVENQVFNSVTSTTVLFRLNAVASLANNLNTHVLIGGSGTLLARVGTAEGFINNLNTQVYSNVFNTVLYRVVQIEAKNTNQDSAINALRPADGYDVVTVQPLPYLTSVYFSSTSRRQLTSNSFLQLNWGREISNLGSGQVCK
jgi:hypothetical protein